MPSRELLLLSRDEIEQVLGELSRAARRATTFEHVTLCVAALLFGVGVALVAAQLGAPRGGLLALGVLAAGAAVLLALWRWSRGLGAVQLLATARLAEGLAPELGTAASSAVDLGMRMRAEAAAFSQDLAELHLDRTASVLRRLDLAARLRARRRRPRRRAAWIAGGCALWSVVMIAALDTGRSRLAVLLLDPSAASFTDTPLASDIRITYRYPAYTGLPERVIEGGDGAISAVVGTEVEITAVSEEEVRSARLRVSDTEAGAARDIPMQISDGRRLTARLSVLRDARYHFALVEKSGDRLEERGGHPIHAQLDAYPEVVVDAPAGDVEVKDDELVDLLWHARDDFGVAEVHLVLERGGGAEPQRIKLAGADKADTRREDRYRWAVAAMGLTPGVEARFYLEAIDNDAVSGPKRGVSTTRRISLFSARKHHEELIARQQQMLDALVDWLGDEVTAPFPAAGGPAVNTALTAQQRIMERISKVETALGTLVNDMRADELTAPEIAGAFANVLEHVATASRERGRALAGAGRHNATRAAFAFLAGRQQAHVGQLERDVIYLDDLLALQRIDALKQTAKDLLSAQRSLQDLLEQYRQTQDPALRAAIEQQISDLRQKMLELLAKMSQIKQGLPSEYRNLEAASMLEVDDQLAELERKLRDGDLEAAAREVEQLANMIENMVNSIDRAEQEYGGERYAEMRQQLAQFAEQFRRLETEQQGLAQRAEELLDSYRKEAVESAGKDLQQFVDKVREKTAEAMAALDEVAGTPKPYRHQVDDRLEGARQRLLDLDALLQSGDFAEAREAGRQAERDEDALKDIIEYQLGWPGSRPDPRLVQSGKAARRASKKTREVNELLDKLFPNPSDVLTPEQMAQMQRMAKKQQGLQQQAEELGAKMDELAGELPLFGGQPRASLQAAEREMGQAVNDVRSGELPGAAGHKRRAADQLGQLRQALEQASQKQGGGLPLPLGMGSGRGRDSGGAGGELSHDEVEIPEEDRNRADPRFRKELLEASKQRAPDRYEEAVRRYYEELIR